MTERGQGSATGFTGEKRFFEREEDLLKNRTYELKDLNKRMIVPGPTVK